VSETPRTRSPLVEEVLKGGNPELQMLAARGVLPLSTEELIPLQVALAEGEDAEVARHARGALEATDPRIMGAFLASTRRSTSSRSSAAAAGIRWSRRPVLRRRDAPPELLAELAERLTADLQEVLLVRQDAIVEHPAILEALERNAS
jgi:alkylhydroperoxidase/carboxymuconolactone decarboxylase family protein YurZ